MLLQLLKPLALFEADVAFEQAAERVERGGQGFVGYGGQRFKLGVQFLVLPADAFGEFAQGRRMLPGQGHQHVLFQPQVVPDQAAVFCQGVVALAVGIGGQAPVGRATGLEQLGQHQHEVVLARVRNERGVALERSVLGHNRWVFGKNTVQKLYF